jgi:hypothetical protein
VTDNQQAAADAKAKADEAQAKKDAEDAATEDETDAKEAKAAIRPGTAGTVTANAKNEAKDIHGKKVK